MWGCNVLSTVPTVTSETASDAATAPQTAQRPPNAAGATGDESFHERYAKTPSIDATKRPDA